ncbi:M43 family zinc metalloprotease [Chitinophaga sp. 22321]|uniref:Choice-of-anchor J domain-containing protein n=1 Tax=Chitinophaga hostae TaxID=2831022 RepID=A0ABS5J0Q0_9BACT|nr:M43 family zinc metalloprotease [Chitinophaga hostae]MBS0028796.1 choice-of-anchor J domain-containing protein [Chitinophaga hostae]
MRQNFIIIILTFFYCATATAQRKCGTAEALQQRVKEKPSLQELLQKNETRMQLGQVQQRLHARTEATPQTVSIPVVVHIVLDDTSLVTAAQILSQLDVLNRDYNAANPDVSQVPAVWQPLIGNTRISFCLAQRTPDDEPTDGVVKVKTAPGQTFSIANGGADAKYSSTGGSDAWDHSRYLNIWVTRISGNYLGVAAPPGTGYPVEQEGVMIQYTAFGTTGSVSGVYNLGRTATHEIGHYFGLKHIWGDDNGSCSIDDGITDTPLQGDNTYGCPTFPKLDNCTNTAPGIMFMNYMDYTDDACMHLFTTGQVDRMRYVLENIAASLMTSNGCVPPLLVNNDASLVNVTDPVGKICNNHITPVVTLRNRGANPLTAVTIWYQLNNGPLTSYKWTGNLASLKQATVTLPGANVAINSYNLKAYTQLPNGVPDGNITNDTAISHFRYDAEATLPLEQGFENDSFPPPGWDLYNPDRSFTWERSRDVGKGSSASALIRNLGYNTNDQTDDLITPVIDPQSADSVFLFFDVAAAVYSDPADTGNSWDTLQVLVTTDCRQTGTILYSKWGPNLITRQHAVQTEFVPTAGEWRRDSVDLTAAIHKGKFQIAFRNISNSENNIYIDNIRIVKKEVNPTLREKGVLVNPNPTDGIVWVTFYQVPEDLQQVSIYNVHGQVIATRKAADIGVGNRLTFNLVNEPNGVYFVKLIYRNRANTIKLMKVR